MSDETISSRNGESLSLSGLATVLETRRLKRELLLHNLQQEAIGDLGVLARLSALAVESKDPLLIQALGIISSAHVTSQSETGAFSAFNVHHLELPIANINLEQLDPATPLMLGMAVHTTGSRAPLSEIIHPEDQSPTHEPIANGFSESHPAFKQLIEMAKPPFVQTDDSGIKHYAISIFTHLLCRTDNNTFDIDSARVTYNVNLKRWLKKYNLTTKTFGKSKATYVPEAVIVRFLGDVVRCAVTHPQLSYSIRQTPFDEEELKNFSTWLGSGKFRRPKAA